MSAKYKEHLEEKFLYTLIPNICKNSDALEEAQGKAKELRKKEIGKYYTDENNIFFDDVKINRKTLAFQKYSSFRGECNAFKNFDEFKKNFNIESLIKDNKI